MKKLKRLPIPEILMGFTLIILGIMLYQWVKCNECGGVFVRAIFWFKCL